MSFSSVCRRAYTRVKRPRGWLAALALAIGLIAAYPSQLGSYGAGGRSQASDLALASEDYIRFTNVLLPAVLIIAQRDVVGLAQIAYVAVAGTIATHGLKRALNTVEVAGTRLGQRPASPTTKHNMPSGHSSLASCGAFFVCRRYGWKWAWLVMPVVLLTMYARVDLSDHTVSAVLAGALIGVLTCLYFVSPKAAER